MDKATKLRLAEQNLAKFRASLASTANKDQVRAQIKAVQGRIRQIKES